LNAVEIKGVKCNSYNEEKLKNEINQLIIRKEMSLTFVCSEKTETSSKRNVFPNARIIGVFMVCSSQLSRLRVHLRLERHCRAYMAIRY